jgi:hypothetical protein
MAYSLCFKYTLKMKLKAILTINSIEKETLSNIENIVLKGKDVYIIINIR